MPASRPAPSTLILALSGAAAFSMFTAAAFNPAALAAGEVAAEEVTAGEVTAEVATARVELPGLAGLVCEGTRCRVLVDGRLHEVDPVSLALGEGRPLDWGARLLAAPSPTLLAPCPPPQAPPAPQGPSLSCARPLEDRDGAAQEAPEAGAASLPAGAVSLPAGAVSLPAGAVSADSPTGIAAAWNQARATGDRLPFAARLPLPGGGLLTTVREAEGHRVMRVGGAARFMDATLGGPGPGYRRNLALHPTGLEAYAIAAPGTALIAFDPRDLVRRWAIPLRPVAHGLFIEPGGRLLLAEEGGAVDPDQLLDLGERAPDLPEGAAPGSDLAMALAERPDAATTAVVDLAAPRLVWREEGRYLSLVALPDGAFLLATDRALVRLVLPPVAP